MEDIKTLRRIYYICPEHKKPAGGIRRIYRHVEALHANGFNASVLHQERNFRITWFNSSAPVSYLQDGVSLRTRDVVVIPESCPDVIKASAKATYQRVVLALSWSLIFAGFPAGEDWRHYGISDVIAGSEYIADFVYRSMRLRATVIRPGNDLNLFSAAHQKTLQIACMPRKNPQDLMLIERIFRARFPEYAAVEFVKIDGSHHADVARVLGESAIFLATGYPEGIARPPLEAMASGCLVVGFGGRGSGEYMADGRNCLFCEDMDVLGAAEKLGEAVSLVQRDMAGSLIQNAVLTAQRYSYETEDRAVAAYWTDHGREKGRAG